MDADADADADEDEDADADADADAIDCVKTAGAVKNQNTQYY